MLLTSSNLSKAAWGELQKEGQLRQLKILSYELGVLSTPSTERHYLNHPHYGFSCTQEGRQGQARGQQGQAGEGHACVDEVELWSLEAWREHQAESRPAPAPAGRVRLYAPLPYCLPPTCYNTAQGHDGRDEPWMVRKYFPGKDSHGLELGPDGL